MLRNGHLVDARASHKLAGLPYPFETSTRIAAMELASFIPTEIEYAGKRLHQLLDCGSSSWAVHTLSRHSYRGSEQIIRLYDHS